MPTGEVARDRELDPRKLTRQDVLKFHFVRRTTAGKNRTAVLNLIVPLFGLENLPHAPRRRLNIPQ